MNIKQVSALHDLMKRAMHGATVLPFVLEEGATLDVHVTLQVSQGVDNGNTYEASLWTPLTLLRFPDLFYLRDDGKVYVYDSEADQAHEVCSVEWRSLGKYSYELAVRAAEEVLV